LNKKVSGSIDILSDQVFHLPDSDSKKMIKNKTTEKINIANNYYVIYDIINNNNNIYISIN